MKIAKKVKYIYIKYFFKGKITKLSQLKKMEKKNLK